MKHRDRNTVLSLHPPWSWSERALCFVVVSDLSLLYSKLALSVLCLVYVVPWLCIHQMSTQSSAVSAHAVGVHLCNPSELWIFFINPNSNNIFWRKGKSTGFLSVLKWQIIIFEGFLNPFYHLLTSIIFHKYYISFHTTDCRFSLRSESNHLNPCPVWMVLNLQVYKTGGCRKCSVLKGS